MLAKFPNGNGGHGILARGRCQLAVSHGAQTQGCRRIKPQRARGSHQCAPKINRGKRPFGDPRLGTVYPCWRSRSRSLLQRSYTRSNNLDRSVYSFQYACAPGIFPLVLSSVRLRDYGGWKTQTRLPGEFRGEPATGCIDACDEFLAIAQERFLLGFCAQ